MVKDLAGEGTSGRIALLAEELRRRVTAGDFPPNALLPTVRSLAASFGCSPVTVSKALNLLERDSVVSRPAGQRRFTAGSGEGGGLLDVEQIPASRTWVSVASDLRYRILTGRYRGSIHFPSIKELRYEYGANYRTIRKALNSLAASGYVSRSGVHWRTMFQGRGKAGECKVYFVSDTHALDPANLQTLRFIRSLETTLAMLDFGALHFMLGAEEHVQFVMPETGPSDRVILYDRRGQDWLPAFLSKKTDRYPVAIDIHDRDSVSSTRGNRCALIKMDNMRAGRAVAMHLYELGHRHIATVAFTDIVDEEWSGHRLAGLREVFPGTTPAEASSCTVFDRLPSWWPTDRADAHDPSKPSPFDEPLALQGITAWVCMSDRMAVDALAVLRHRGVEVPGRLSLVSFDNSSVGYRCGLTTYDLGMEHLGYLAASLLIRNRPVAVGAEGCLRVRGGLVVRESTAPLSRH